VVEPTRPTESIDPQSVRARLQSALAGEPVQWPVYAAYDWFVQNRPVDWQMLFGLGLGQIAHAELVRVRRPHLEIVESTRVVEGAAHREVRWITDRGELTESFVGEWQQQYLVKCAHDYRILHRAFEDVRYTADSAPFLASEAAIGDGGITLGMLGWTPLRRTPLLQVQIDFAGPERFALDLADRVPPLMDLLDLLGHLTLEKFREAVKTPARYIKLWENLSIDMLGVRAFREQVVPMYGKVLEILEPAGKELLVHYDGKLRVIAGDIAELPLHIDSFTPPPEGDMTAREARAAWPQKFLWLHPPLGWYQEPRRVLVERLRQMARDAGPSRYCLMISEEVPPDWQQTITAVLETLAESFA